MYVVALETNIKYNCDQLKKCKNNNGNNKDNLVTVIVKIIKQTITWDIILSQFFKIGEICWC